MWWRTIVSAALPSSPRCRSWIVRHSTRSRAATPTGSKPWIISRVAPISSGEKPPISWSSSTLAREIAVLVQVADDRAPDLLGALVWTRSCRAARSDVRRGPASRRACSRTTAAPRPSRSACGGRRCPRRPGSTTRSRCRSYGSRGFAVGAVRPPSPRSGGRGLALGALGGRDLPRAPPREPGFR